MSSRSNSVIVAPYIAKSAVTNGSLGSSCNIKAATAINNNNVNGHHGSYNGNNNTGTQKSESGSITSRFRFLSWNEDEIYPIQDFLRRFPLPRVIRITNCDQLPPIVKKGLVTATTGATGDSSNNSNISNGIDITQPILFYKKYRPVKIQGKCLKVQKNGKLKEIGSSFILPDSFPGWFSLLSIDGKECAMTLTSMGQIAAARVPAFLTKFDVPVYKLTESHEAGAKSVYVRSTVRAGSVLRLLGIWADLGQQNPLHHQSYGYPAATPGIPPGSGVNGGLFVGGSVRGSTFSPYYNPDGGCRGRAGSLSGFGGRLVARSLSHVPPQYFHHNPHTHPFHHHQQQPIPTTNTSQYQYIQCLNQENEVLFVPFTATGVFYPIAPRGGRNPQHIYPLSAIARIQRLPIRIKMVFGALPSNMPDFSGTFELENVTNEDAILACTLLKEKPTLFELDPNIGYELLLSQMMSDDLFIKSASYQSALKYCHSEGDNWKKAVKPCLNLFGGKKNSSGSGGTITAAVLKKSLKLRNSSKSSSTNLFSLPPVISTRPAIPTTTPGGSTGSGVAAATPSRLSLLFRNNNNSSKDPLRRSKSFNIETQSVSLNLAQDYDDQTINTKVRPPKTPDIHHKRRSLFNFMASKYQNNSNCSTQKSDDLHYSKLSSSSNNNNNNNNGPDVLFSRNQSKRHSISAVVDNDDNDDDEVPYGRVVDDLQRNSSKHHHGNKNDDAEDEDDDVDSDENIYAEIPEEFALKLNIMSPFHHLPYHHRHNILVEGSSGDSGVGGSNMSSLIKGGGCCGGSDGTFSGGTFSSSNPSSTEEEIYDNIF